MSGRVSGTGCNREGDGTSPRDQMPRREAQRAHLDLGHTAHRGDMMNTPVQAANESATNAARLEKPLVPNSPTTNLYILGFRLYHKRVTFLARRVPEAFAVHTPDGMQQGSAGDYVILNLSGECWPISARLFKETYGQAAS